VDILHTWKRSVSIAVFTWLQDEGFSQKFGA
jgi:hypothetical protein